jgi:hypothetical protein
MAAAETAPAKPRARVAMEMVFILGEVGRWSLEELLFANVEG